MKTKVYPAGWRWALVRPLVRDLEPYVPGEQPAVKGLIKLNTNENPYAPAPRVLAAIRAATDDRLRLYPNPTAQTLRTRLARFHRCQPEQVFVGNGSDEILALATRAFVDPCPGLGRGLRKRRAAGASRSTIQFFTPSYSLYPVLAAIHGAIPNPVTLDPDFGLPSLPTLRRTRAWDFNAALSYITTPNAPTGRGYSSQELEALCRAQDGVVVLDEAYADFAEENALPLGLTCSNVLVSRTFSKSYCLCFLRVGYCLGHPDLIGALDKIRDSYNVNGLGQIAALATLDSLPYYRARLRRLKLTRARTSRHLEDLGFQVFPSQTNFLFVRPPLWPAEAWVQRLRERKILVRWFQGPATSACLRISIGTESQMTALLRAAREILDQH